MFLLYPANVVREEACWVQVELPLTISIAHTPVVMASVFACTDSGMIIKNSTTIIPKIKNVFMADLDYILKHAFNMEPTVLFKVVNSSEFNLAKHKQNIEDLFNSGMIQNSLSNTLPKGI